MKFSYRQAQELADRKSVQVDSLAVSYNFYYFQEFQFLPSSRIRNRHVNWLVL